MLISIELILNVSVGKKIIDLFSLESTLRTTASDPKFQEITSFQSVWEQSVGGNCVQTANVCTIFYSHNRNRWHSECVRGRTGIHYISCTQLKHRTMKWFCEMVFATRMSFLSAMFQMIRLCNAHECRKWCFKLYIATISMDGEKGIITLFRKWLKIKKKKTIEKTRTVESFGCSSFNESFWEQN